MCNVRIAQPEKKSQSKFGGENVEPTSLNNEEDDSRFVVTSH